MQLQQHNRKISYIKTDSDSIRTPIVQMTLVHVNVIEQLHWVGNVLSTY